MTEDKLAFLDQPRDEQGRFAPTKTQDEQPVQEALPEPPAPEQPAPEPVQQASVEPPAHPKVPDGYIPINAVLDERDKRQAIQREFEEYKRKFAERQEPPAPPPDPIADPDGFQRALDEKLMQTQWDATTRISLRFALQQHGADAVKAAEDWVREQVQSNPAFAQSIRQQMDPYDFVVRSHKRHVAMSKLGDDDPEAWAAKWAEQNGYVKAGAQQQAVGEGAHTPQPTPLPKPSLATARSAGGTAPRVPMGPGAAFDGVFKS